MTLGVAALVLAVVANIAINRVTRNLK